MLANGGPDPEGPVAIAVDRAEYLQVAIQSRLGSGHNHTAFELELDQQSS